MRPAKHLQASAVESTRCRGSVSGAKREKSFDQFINAHRLSLSLYGQPAQTKTARLNPGRFGDRGWCGVKPRQPINASMARRIGSGRVGQALTTLTGNG